MSLRSVILLLACSLPLQLLLAQQIPDDSRRHVISLNESWEYLEDASETPLQAGASGSAWVPVSIPHTWNARDVVDADPGYRRSASWYRRGLSIPALKQEKRFVLAFEGVNISCDIYVNGVRAGGHVGGYVPFDVEITPLLRPGTNNAILIRVDNSVNRDIIPSQKSDFSVYGGITRDVWLKVLPATFISGIAISTPSVTAGEATVETMVRVSAQVRTPDGTVIESQLIDPDGHVISTAEIPLGNGPSGGYSVTHRVSKPKLWSPSHPQLYEARIRIKQNKNVLDEVTDRFGLRWFEFVPGGPFKLNGERLLLRGTHRHEDWAGLGNALPDSLHRKDMRMIKEMGANFVRLAHYPQDPEVYRACDELGLLVWDELPWCRGGMGGADWRANTTRLLKEQIEQYYNHPSIIIRSLGNEMYWLPDFAGGDDPDSLRSVLAELNAIAHRLDPGRLTATRKYTEEAELVDVVSPSMWPGWYGGFYKGYETALAEARKRFPRFFHAEYGGDSHVGRHNESPISGDAMQGGGDWEENIKPQKVRNVAQDGDWSESYIVDLFDWMLSVSERTEWFTGNAQWAFKDFPTPLRPENPIPYMNQKGLVDRAGNPKDAYYVFKSYWSKSPKFAYIESHTWDERSGPKGSAREVNVYSNCPEVELSVNGKSLGKRTKTPGSFPASGLHWSVIFEEGPQHIVATGFSGGVVAAKDTVRLHYYTSRHELPDHLEFSSSKQGDGTLLLTVVAVDKNGRRCLDYNKRVYFRSDGPGRLLVDEGTPTRSSVIEMASGRARIEFIPADSGRTVVEVRNQDFKGAYVEVKAGVVVRTWY